LKRVEEFNKCITNNKGFVHQVGNKAYHYIRIHGQQNIKKKL